MMDRTPDLVVVGAGGAGLMAAAVAGARGRRVLLLERDSRVPSNTVICGGLVPAAGTRWQRAAGIEDSPGAMAADVRAKNGGQVDGAVLDAICRRSADAIEFLAGPVGLAIHLHTGILHPGLSRHRLHATPGETGAEIVAGLRRALARWPGVTMVDGWRADRLLVDSGRVVGVGAADGGSAEARAVVLATGGFGAAADLVRRHCPSAAEAFYMGSTSNDGSALRMGMAVGADAAHLAGYQAHSHANPDHGTHLGGSLPSLGAILVNLMGRRFAREDQSYSDFAPAILAQPGNRAVEIFDGKAYAAAESLGPFREAVEAGAVSGPTDARGLADAFGLPGDILAETLAAYDQGARRGQDAFGRTQFLRPLDGPFFGSLVAGALAHTQGGLRIDAGARVLDRAGKPIPGLLAAGGAAAGISGDDPTGYLSGNGLAHALVTGLLAAATATA